MRFNRGIRNIKGFDGVFMDERSLEGKRKRWKKGREKKEEDAAIFHLDFCGRTEAKMGKV